MLKSITYIFKYNSREVSVKVRDGKYHFVYVRFTHVDFHYSARFLILSEDYPTYDSIKAFADRLKSFDKEGYEAYKSTHSNYPIYNELWS